MTATDLLARLESIGIRLQAADGKLRVSATRDQLTDELKTAIAANKSDLLELLASRSVERSPIPRLPRGGPLPTSFFQERVWAMSKFASTTAYNMAVGWPSAGPVDVERLEHAIREMASRHELLRARFQDDDGVPSIVLMDPRDVPIEVRDLRGQSIEAQRAAFDAVLHAELHTPFDLETEAPVRFVVFRGDADRVATLISAHHIAVDAWSLEVLRQEIFAAYEDAPPPPPPDVQYVDFAAWQRAVQDPRVIQSELDWWKRRLAGAPPLSTLPPDLERSAEARGTTHFFQFSRELTAGIHAMAREQGVTVYMALVSACAAMLHWYTAQDDIVLGSPMGARERPDFERIVGPFVNILLLRMSLADDPTFAQLLERARSAVLDAHDHRQVSFERLVQHLNPARSADHDTLFQVAVVYQTGSGAGGSAIASGGALFELTWFVREQDGELTGALEYRTDLFSAEMIAGVMARLEQILTQAVADPARKLSDFSLVTPAESARVLSEFNATDRESNALTFAERFERQVAATPDAIAVSCDGSATSYRALDERANRIARHLVSLGVGPGVVVALCMPRSVEMLAALIAVHKSGGAYLPLDPDFPAERLGFMLADSGAHAVVTNGPLPVGVSGLGGVAVVDLASNRAAIDVLGASNLESKPQASDLAYLIYTSGSTGQPKGVCISHGALSNFLGSMEREPGLSGADTLAAVTTLSFDIATLELYLPLIVGARIELVSRDVAIDGERLARLLDETNATMMQATPATWRMLVEAGWSGQPGFRALTGGEALPPDLAAALLPRVAELWNMYGPTETTVWSTIARVRSADQITIGRPIDNTRVYVLDAARRVLPIGVAGELWIGGAGVATGYHARPDLTAARFVADPFATDRPGTRMYRTGDRARWRTDGTLEHLGRIDHQIKVRGYRIEPGEIEAVFETHDAVRQAIVVARKQGSGDVRLVAYVTYEEGEDLSVSEARRWLRARLPDYMIPSLFISLETLPLTPNGKIDRNALPDPFLHGRAAVAPERTPPAPGIELVLADIWRSVLQTTTVSAEDNFFDLGGHSLLALRVAAAVHKRTGWRMDPRQLFFQPLRQIAATAPPGLLANQTPA